MVFRIEVVSETRGGGGIGAGFVEEDWVFE